MKAEQEKLATVLKEAGFSLTQPRLQVFRSLLDRSEPVSMKELVAALPLIDRASIYRTVQLFETLGVVNRLPMGWKYKLELSDAFVHHHHHLTCSSCGLLVSVPEHAQLESYIAGISHSYGFTPVDHQFEIVGLCARCAQKRTPDIRPES